MRRKLSHYLHPNTFPPGSFLVAPSVPSSFKSAYALSGPYILKALYKRCLLLVCSVCLTKRRLCCQPVLQDNHLIVKLLLLTRRLTNDAQPSTSRVSKYVVMESSRTKQIFSKNTRQFCRAQAQHLPSRKGLNRLFVNDRENSPPEE